VQQLVYLEHLMNYRGPACTRVQCDSCSNALPPPDFSAARA
jgi:hypothetical protein